MRRQQVGVSARSARAGGGGSGNRTSSSFHASPGALIDAVGNLLKLHWRGIVALGLLVGISYFPALDAEFLWDDRIWTDEPVVKEWSGFSRIWLAPSEIQHEAHYWPVVYSSFWLEHKLWGLDPTGYHAVNIFLHFANCLLLWVLMLRLEVKGAWAVAAVFAVHPLHVDSVAWIIERKDLLSALFYLAAAMTWFRFVDASRPSRYWGAVGLFVLALFSKSIVVTLPVALLIWHAWKRGPVSGADVLRLVPFFAVAILVTAADLAFYRGLEPLSLGYSLVERALIAARALFFYAGKLLWPAELAVIYPHWDVDASDPVSWGFLVGAAAVPAVLWALRQRIGTGPLVGAAFFALTLSPVLGFVDYGYMQFSFVADRHQYLAGCGVLAVLASAGAHAAGRLKGAARMAAHAAGAAVLVLLMVKTWSQAGVYRNGLTFFQHIVALNPNAREAHNNLADALLFEGRFEEAAASSRIAIEQRPDDANAYVNLGRSLVNLGSFDEADEALRKARELDPDSASVAQIMGELLRKSGRVEESLERFREAANMDPDFPLPHAGMGQSLYQLGRYEEARDAFAKAMSLLPRLSIDRYLHRMAGRTAWKLKDLGRAAQHFQIVLESDPDAAGILLDLGRVRLEQRRFEEGLEHLRHALDLRSGDSATVLEVGDALRRSGYAEQSLSFYRQVLEQSPANAGARAGTGLALLELERYPESVKALEEAIALDPELPIAGELHRHLGTAHVELGNFEEAVENFTRAIESDPDDTDSMDRLGLLFFEHGRFQDALDQYLAMAEFQPDGAQVHVNIGTSLVQLGRDEEAIPVFERAQALDPDFAGLDSTLEILRRAVGIE